MVFEGAGREMVWAGLACVDGRATVEEPGFVSGAGLVMDGAGIVSGAGRVTAGAVLVSGPGRETADSGLT
jgi:hypothetical protein